MLLVHPMPGFDRGKVRSRWGVPNDWKPVVMMVIGYWGDLQTLTKSLREKELELRIHKPLPEFAFTGG
ncbi:MAG: hypothetical protein MH252_04605 [Thermosynechococcaceae cyanobacterium MS004]|nr:hypothetical protein [Thermosynechococcaceae cyanobacterium MS004]